MRKLVLTREQAEILALRGLAYLAGDAHRLGGFLAVSGVAPDDIRGAAGDPAFLGAVLDHILADEPLLLSFCEDEHLTPEAPAIARARLPGAPFFD